MHWKREKKRVGMGYARADTEETEDMECSFSVPSSQNDDSPSPRVKKGGRDHDEPWISDIEHQRNSNQVS